MRCRCSVRIKYYAWVVSNNTVTATTITISAQLNAPFLKIDKDQLANDSTTVATRADETSVAFIRQKLLQMVQVRNLYQYLAVEDGQSPITITAKKENWSETVTGSMRVAITTQESAYVKRYK